MSTQTFNRNNPPIIAAANEWRERCLVGDGSIFSEERLWTAERFGELDTFFGQRRDAGDGSFYEKLETQMADAPAQTRRLMAEVLWALFLFPSNIGIETKRDAIVRVWGWSGEKLDARHPMLTDTILDGIGSGGMGVNTNRWREIVYIVGFGIALKRLLASERASVLASYDQFIAWIRTVPQEGERQFRHMLRYFLFPERVERISSNGDRRRILNGFEVAGLKTTRKWSDQQLDDALMTLRGQLELQHGTKVLDFYRPPLRGVWKHEAESDEPQVEESGDVEVVREDSGVYPNIATRPINLILYGPPGTGKTYRIQQMFARYTDLPADIDRNTWAQELLTRFGWRSVIASAIAALGTKARVASIADHPIVRAKALQRERRGGVTQTIWGYLQAHTPLDVETVRFANRREPFIFTKSEESEWALVSDWRERDVESAELHDAWTKGPGASRAAIERYRVVTFHPSYSYEDFVVGLRPVAAAEDEAGEPTKFRMVDGVFKQLCAAARANPAKRYALFIDEINRANIAKVFGELITLIEPDKRSSHDAAGQLVAGMEVQLPGSSGASAADSRFGVPANLDIYGTMNTADRSIALLDIALRRRFEFEEIAPRYDLIERSVDGVELAKLLASINARLEYLLDRDHRIGHAYFVKVKSLEELQRSFERQIIPLLQEYFFDDWSRVMLVLSDGSGKSALVGRSSTDALRLFGMLPDGVDDTRNRYEVTPSIQWTAESFRLIYAPAPSESPA